MTPSMIPTTFGGWVRLVLVGVILSGAVYVSWLVYDSNQRGRGDTEVLASVDQAISNQQATGQSTECSRLINSAGEIAQLETLDTLQDALLDLITTNNVTPAVEQDVRDLDVLISDAVDGYREINERCPTVGGTSSSLGDPNDSED